MENKPRILLIGLPPELGQRLGEELASRGCTCECVEGPGHGVARASWDPPAIVVLDERGDSGRTQAVVEALREASEDLQVVGVGERPAVDALVHLASTARESGVRPAVVADRRRPRVLLVDDDADLREVLRLELEDSGFDVLEARDGIDALAHMADVRPDVVLLDLMMPRMSGEALLERLREVSLDPPPVVVYTARTAVDERVRDVTAVLHKPSTSSEVIEALRSSLGGGAQK